MSRALVLLVVLVLGCGAPFVGVALDDAPPVEMSIDPGEFIAPPPLEVVVEDLGGWAGPSPTWFAASDLDVAPDCPVGSLTWDVRDYAGSSPVSECGACSCEWHETTPDPLNQGYVAALVQGFTFNANCSQWQASGPGIGWNGGHGFWCSNNMQPPAMVTASKVGFGNFGYPEVDAHPSTAPDNLEPVNPTGRLRRCEGSRPSVTGFLSCVATDGSDQACPLGYPDRHVIATDYQDDRACTTCGCQAAIAKRSIKYHLFQSYDCSGAEVGTFTTSRAGQYWNTCNPADYMSNGPAFASVMPELIMPPAATVTAPPTLAGGVEPRGIVTFCCAVPVEVP